MKIGLLMLATLLIDTLDILEIVAENQRIRATSNRLESVKRFLQAGKNDLKLVVNEL